MAGHMTQTKEFDMKLSLMLAVPAVALAFATAGFAAEHEVKMLNKGEEGVMVFEPSFVKAEPGDVIHFIAVDKGHDVVSIKGGLPEGAEEFAGKMNQDFDLTVEVPGLYAYECKPHFGMGMVGVIQVGDDASNLDAIKELKMPKKARERMESALANVEGAE